MNILKSVFPFLRPKFRPFPNAKMSFVSQDGSMRVSILYEITADDLIVRVDRFINGKERRTAFMNQKIYFDGEPSESTFNLKPDKDGYGWKTI